MIMNMYLLFVFVLGFAIAHSEDDPKLKKWLRYCTNLPEATYDPVCCLFVGLGCPTEHADVADSFPDDELKPFAGRWVLANNGQLKNSSKYEQLRGRQNFHTNWNRYSNRPNRLSRRGNYRPLGENLMVAHPESLQKYHHDVKGLARRVKHSFLQPDPRMMAFYQYPEFSGISQGLGLQPANPLQNYFDMNSLGQQLNAKISPPYFSDGNGFQSFLSAPSAAENQDISVQSSSEAPVEGDQHQFENVNQVDGQKESESMAFQGAFRNSPPSGFGSLPFVNPLNQFNNW